MPDKPIKLGSHMSIAGGYYKAVEAAAQVGCDCVQLFTKNNNQWRAKPIEPAESNAFLAALDQHAISHPLSHASYLINLASPDDALREKSVEALIVEVERAHRLAIPNVVVHPGAFTTSTPEEGLDKIIRSLIAVIQQSEAFPARILLENTAGQGSTLGWQLEQLAFLLEGCSGQAERLGICIDTCHAFAAGYDLASDTGFTDFVDRLERTVGLDRIQALHVNDSKKGLGSRVDRHEHIGDGALGLGAFQRILRHPRLSRIPMYLETEKGEGPDGRDWDAVNLQRLRDCLA